MGAVVAGHRAVDETTGSQSRRPSHSYIATPSANPRAAGATADQLKPIFELQKKAMWRLDFISSEKSKGFHADQEAMRILVESIDYSRQAHVKALELRAAKPPPSLSRLNPSRA